MIEYIEGANQMYIKWCWTIEEQKQHLLTNQRKFVRLYFVVRSITVCSPVDTTCGHVQCTLCTHTYRTYFSWHKELSKSESQVTQIYLNFLPLDRVFILLIIYWENFPNFHKKLRKWNKINFEYFEPSLHFDA